MKPNIFIERLKEYPLSSHKAWEIKNKKDVLKLDWNESNLLLPEKVKKRLIEFIKKGPTFWYPDVFNRTLIKEIAKYLKISPSCIQYFEGSDSALDYVVRTFLKQKDEVAISSPTYDNFRVYVEAIGAKINYIFGKDIFSTDIKNLLKNLSHKTKLLYLCNPNNPTGAFYSKEEIEKILKSFPKTILLVDEAYAEFTQKTVVSLVKKYNNLIVSRSFSKAFGLASFRLGYLVTAPENISYINKIRNGKNISAIAQIAALHILRNKKYMEKYVEEIKRAKAMTVKNLREMGFSVIETPANFILIKTNNPSDFCKKLEKQKIFVRNLSHLPFLKNYIRITIWSSDSMKRFIQKLKKINESKNCTL
jgi:histidinol-phosphate aminotransferase